MENHLTVLIVDSDVIFATELSERFAQSQRFAVAKPAHNGLEAMKYIISNKPEIIILDLSLPDYDALYLLNCIRADIPNYKPFIWILSELEVSKANKILFNLDIAYFSVKPISPEVAVNSVMRIIDRTAYGHSMLFDKGAPPLNRADAESHIIEYLRHLGAPVYRTSGKCTVKVIQTALENQLTTNMKKIYQMAGDTLVPRLTFYAVERNVRSVIKYLVENPAEYLHECFPDCADGIRNNYFINHSVYLIKKMMGEL